MAFLQPIEIGKKVVAKLMGHERWVTGNYGVGGNVASDDADVTLSIDGTKGRRRLSRAMTKRQQHPPPKMTRLDPIANCCVVFQLR